MSAAAREFPALLSRLNSRVDGSASSVSVRSAALLPFPKDGTAPMTILSSNGAVSRSQWCAGSPTPSSAPATLRRSGRIALRYFGSVSAPQPELVRRRAFPTIRYRHQSPLLSVRALEAKPAVLESGTDKRSAAGIFTAAVDGDSSFWSAISRQRTRHFPPLGLSPLLTGRLDRPHLPMRSVRSFEKFISHAVPPASPTTRPSTAASAGQVPPVVEHLNVRTPFHFRQSQKKHRRRIFCPPPVFSC